MDSLAARRRNHHCAYFSVAAGVAEISRLDGVWNQLKQFHQGFANMIREIAVFDAVEEGISKLYCMLCDTESPKIRNQIRDLIYMLESGERKTALFIWVNNDGSLSPLIIGGSPRMRKKIRGDLETLVQHLSERTLH